MVWLRGRVIREIGPVKRPSSDLILSPLPWFYPPFSVSFSFVKLPSTTRWWTRRPESGPGVLTLTFPSSRIIRSHFLLQIIKSQSSYGNTDRQRQQPRVLEWKLNYQDGVIPSSQNSSVNPAAQLPINPQEIVLFPVTKGVSRKTCLTPFSKVFPGLLS